MTAIFKVLNLTWGDAIAAFPHFVASLDKEMLGTAIGLFLIAGITMLVAGFTFIFHEHAAECVAKVSVLNFVATFFLAGFCIHWGFGFILLLLGVYGFGLKLMSVY